VYFVDYCIGLYLTSVNSRTWIFNLVHIFISQHICKTSRITLTLREKITLKKKTISDIAWFMLHAVASYAC
jgi:hypothetical protein